MGEGGPSSSGGGNPAVVAKGGRISRRLLAIVVVLVVGCAAAGSAFVMLYTPNSKITVTVTNLSNETALFNVYREGSKVGTGSLPGGSIAEQEDKVLPGKYNITIRYSYTGGEVLEKSKTVKVDAYSEAKAPFAITNPHPLVTPHATLSKATITDGKKFTFISVNMSLSWDNVTLVLSDGTEKPAWQPSSAALSGAMGAHSALGSHSINGATVWCNATDLSGNGLVNSGDYFTLTWSSMYPLPADPYSVFVLFFPNSMEIASISFTP